MIKIRIDSLHKLFASDLKNYVGPDIIDYHNESNKEYNHTEVAR